MDWNFSGEDVYGSFTRDPWKHQVYSVGEVCHKFAQGIRSVVLCVPTGGGKSLITSSLINLMAARRGRIIVYNSRRLLTQQSYDGLIEEGLDVGTRAASMRDYFDPNAMVQIAQLQTDIARVIKQQRWDLYPANLVVIDEAHMALSEKPIELMQRYLAKGAFVLGLTGTPIGMSGAYRDITVAATNSELRSCGAHVPARCFSVHEMDVSQIKKEKNGEYSEGSIIKECWNQAIVGYIYEDWKRLNPDCGLTLCAAPGIGESIWVAEKFRAKGLRVAHIDCNKVVVNGETYQNDTKGTVRNQVIKDVKSGMYDILCHCDVVREGVDITQLRHIILARPYGSLANYIQSVGRVIRSAPGKDVAIVQDHGGNCLDSETEVLTKDGWKGMHDSFDVVAGFNLETQEVTWEPVTDRIERPLRFGEKMVAARGDVIDIRVTEGHDIIWRQRSRGTTRKSENPYRKSTAIELSSSKSHIEVPISGYINSPGVGLSASWLELVGWYISDGYIDSARRQLIIRQAEHQPQIQDLERAIRECNLDYKKHFYEQKPDSRIVKSSRVCVIRVPQGTSSKLPRRGYAVNSRYFKKDLADDLLDCTREELLSLLMGIHFGDGKKGLNAGNYYISTGSRRLADRLQAMCVTRGIRCNIRTETPSKKSFGTKPVYKIKILIRRDCTEVAGGGVITGKSTKNFATFRECESTPGEMVWCVSNPTGCIVTRRNGKVAILGNCTRHGSPNANRDWAKLFSMTEKEIAAERKQNIQEGKEKAPIVCIKCGTVRLEGAKCPSCGHQADPKLRCIIEKDGKLVEKIVDEYAKPPEPQPIELKRLKEIFFSMRRHTGKSPPESQVLAIYAKKHGEYPAGHYVDQWRNERELAGRKKRGEA